MYKIAPDSRAQTNRPSAGERVYGRRGRRLALVLGATAGASYQDRGAKRNCLQNKPFYKPWGQG